MPLFVVLVFENIGESLVKIYRLTSLLSVGSEICERLLNKKLVRCGYFSDFQYDFNFSRATINLLIVVFFFDRSLTRALAGLEFLEL